MISPYDVIKQLTAADPVPARTHARTHTPQSLIVVHQNNAVNMHIYLDSLKEHGHAFKLRYLALLRKSHLSTVVCLCNLCYIFFYSPRLYMCVLYFMYVR